MAIRSIGCMGVPLLIGFEILSGWGMVEGYGLLCPECFEIFLNDVQMKDVKVFWEDGTTTSEECGDVFSKPKTTLKDE